MLNDFAFYVKRYLLNKQIESALYLAVKKQIKKLINGHKLDKDIFFRLISCADKDESLFRPLFRLSKALNTIQIFNILHSHIISGLTA
jgi:hypothetical protein